MDKLLTAKQVCQRLGGISDMCLWRWLQDEKLDFPEPFYIRHYRYWHASAVEEWIESQGDRKPKRVRL